MATATARATISIGTMAYATSASSVALALADYSADTFTSIGSLSDLGDFGDTASEIKVETIDSGRVFKLNGTRDGGDMTLIVYRDASDAGQLAAIAASKADFNHNFKVVMNDPTNATGTGSTYYFRGLATSATNKLGTANNAIMTTFKIAINSALLFVAPTAGV